MLFKSSVEEPEVHWRGLREMPGCLAEQPTPQGRQRRPGNNKLRDTSKTAIILGRQTRPRNYKLRQAMHLVNSWIFQRNSPVFLPICTLFCFHKVNVH